MVELISDYEYIVFVNIKYFLYLVDIWICFFFNDLDRKVLVVEFFMDIRVILYFL